MRAKGQTDYGERRMAVIAAVDSQVNDTSLLSINPLH
jgi:hypothetical protein